MTQRPWTFSSIQFSSINLPQERYGLQKPTVDVSGLFSRIMVRYITSRKISRIEGRQKKDESDFEVGGRRDTDIYEKDLLYRKQPIAGTDITIGCEARKKKDSISRFSPDFGSAQERPERKTKITPGNAGGKWIKNGTCSKRIGEQSI